LRVGLGVYRGESRGEGVGDRDEEDDGIGRSGLRCGQSGESGQLAPVLQFYPGVLYSSLWYGHGFVIAAVFSHVRIGESGRLAWWWDEVGL